MVRTATLSIPVPEVIVLSKYGQIPKRHLAFSRHNLFKRDGYQCQYCGDAPGSRELTIDHVLPRAQGGVSSWTNCVVACVPCNRFKANRTPEQAKMTLRNTPDKPSFSPRMIVARMGVKASWDRFVSEAYWNVELDA
jgi:5-methylcytosine-specific restriction endonuclease McrA